MSETDRILFSATLIEGIVEKCKSQFTMMVQVQGESVACHCPTTGRIGTIEVAGRPCLLSASNDSARKTPYTVEAVSLNRPEDAVKSWIGINQNAANRYVEHYLVNGGFADMVGTGNEVRREQFLGASKLDCLVGSTYLEVKTPLQTLQVELPEWVKTKKVTPFSSTDRFVRHITELANSLQSHQRAILLTNFLYDNPGFEVIDRSTHYEQVKSAVDAAQERGVEIWQSNFRIDPDGVLLEKYFRISV